MWRTLYSPVSYGDKNALIPTQLGNDKIKWESTVQKDLGLDFSFMRGRLGGTFGYYHKVTDGTLLNMTPAPSSSYSTVVFNISFTRGLEVVPVIISISVVIVDIWLCGLNPSFL